MKRFFLLVVSLLLISSLVFGASLTLKATWTPNAEADMKEYRLYKVDGNIKTLIGTIPHPPTLPYIFSLTIPDSGSGSAIFTLTAVDTSGNESGVSNFATVPFVDQVAPTVPKDLSITSSITAPPLPGGAVYYISSAGTAAWASCTNIDTPCSAVTAFANAKAGDTVYFRGGTYTVPSGITYTPTNTGTLGNPITFMAYPGEIPIMNGILTPKVTGTATVGTTNTLLFDSTKNFSSYGIIAGDTVRTQNTTKGGAWVLSIASPTSINLETSLSMNNMIGFTEGDYYEIGKDNVTLFNTYQKEYIVLDGFTFQSTNSANGDSELPGVMFQGSGSPYRQGNQIKNCTFIGPSVKKIVHGDNRHFLGINYSSNILVKNCNFTNNFHVKEWTGTRVTNNTSALTTYHNDHVTVENCNVINTSGGVFFKSDTDDSIIRNNWIYNNATAIWISPDVGMESDRVSVNNNVIAQTSLGGSLFSVQVSGPYHSDDTEVYNNTFYSRCAVNLHGGGPGLGVTQSGHGYKFYNNIVKVSANYMFVLGDADGVNRNYLKEADHNQWSTPFYRMWIGSNWRNLYYNSLAAWQATTHLEVPFDAGCGLNQNPGCGDLSSDPMFVNSSGTMTQLSDFALQPASPSKGTGRGGIDMGADITKVGIKK